MLLVISLMRAAAPDPRDSFRTAPLPAVGEERQETLQKRQEFQQLLADMRHDMAQVMSMLPAQRPSGVCLHGLPWHLPVDCECLYMATST